MDPPAPVTKTVLPWIIKLISPESSFTLSLPRRSLYETSRIVLTETSPEHFETKKSNYQVMEWTKRASDDDTCLHLDEMLQICSSYRPHYHEFFVHFPAQFVKKVKRVMFLGSGDAMLLHEILKYPDLEKVVGLDTGQLHL